MKKQSRIVAMALATAMVLGTTALAAGGKTIEVLSGMKLVLNGQEVTPLKSDGTAAEVFAYEGATYVPVRFVSENLGAKVDYDAAQQAAVISGGLTYADTIVWNGEYDVIVAGFGGAGAVAARYAADAGARVLLTEKAPEGHEGGNTRYCGQLFVNGHGDEEATRAYYDALKMDYEVPDDMLEVYTKAIAHLEDKWVSDYGLNKADFVNSTGLPFLGDMSPEYPELPGADKISLDTLHEGYGDAYLWQILRRHVTDRADKIDVWFESPAVRLIQDPVTKTILGVTIEREGKEVNIKANNGVVLATGGFENDPEMVESYLGFTNSRPMGTTYNTGDGVRMAMEVGADLWHMHVYESGNTSLTYMTEEGARGSWLKAGTTGSAMIVGADGSRFFREDTITRHGHVYYTGSWKNPLYSTRDFVVYDSAKANDGLIPEQFQGQVIKADTLKELAEKTGMDPDILKTEVERFNGYAKTGVDVEFGRAAENMTAFSAKGPYYAIEVVPAVLNTQGGPRRNARAEVLDYEGNPIPHLYSAGELGGICAYQYQGGGNVAECIIFGEIAGKNAAAPKEEGSAPLTAARDEILFTPGAVSDTKKDGPVIETKAGEYVGVSNNGMGGKVTVKVTMKDGKIAAVEVVEHHETAGISDPAIAQMPEKIVKAGSTEVDNVSGATISSKAIKEAVADALSQVK